MSTRALSYTEMPAEEVITRAKAMTDRIHKRQEDARKKLVDEAREDARSSCRQSSPSTPCGTIRMRLIRTPSARSRRMNTHEDLAYTLNDVADYANVLHVFYAKPGPTPETSVVWTSPSTCEFLVDTTWAKGNAKRLPDRTNAKQMLEILVLSHPDTLGVGPDTPER